MATATPTAPTEDAPAVATKAPPSGRSSSKRGGNTLNIGELKDMSIAKLTQVAKDLTVAGATGMRKQELIFQILKAQTEQSGFIFSEGVLEVLRMASDSYGLPTTTICQGPTTSTCPRPRFGSSICKPATQCRDRFGRRRRGSAISR